MPSKFFEISLDSLPYSENLECRKYEPEQYREMGKSLGNVQDCMNQGKTGKEILGFPDSDNPRGISNTYSNFYTPQSGDRVKVDFKDDGSFGSYTNGRHRVEAAREAGLTHIPAEVSSPSEDSLRALENQHGSGRDLTQYNPKEERDQLDREIWQSPSSPDPINSTNQPVESAKHGGPSAGPDPFINLREKYGNSQNSNSTDDLAKTSETSPLSERNALTDKYTSEPCTPPSESVDKGEPTKV